MSGARAASPRPLSSMFRRSAARPRCHRGAAVTDSSPDPDASSPAPQHTPRGSPEIDDDRERNQQRERPQPSEPARAEGYQDQGERHEVVAEPVAELDPTL